MLTILPRCSFFAALYAVVLAGASLASADRTYSAGRFALFLDGEALGFARQVRGGTIKADVVTETVGPENIIRKHISTIKYEPLTIEIGMGMSKEIYDWINQSWDQEFGRRSGEIVAVDSSHEAMVGREFFDARITEVTFPALDASSKEPAYMTVKVKPEEIVYWRGDGVKSGFSDGHETTQKQWSSNSFRFELGNLPCQGVSRIDSFSIKQVVHETDTGRDRMPARVEVSNLKLTISMADIDPWYDWFEDFVIRGNCGDADELEGSFILLAPDTEEDLGRVELSNVGIVSLELDESSAGGESVRRISVELYVESMDFVYGGGFEGDRDDDEKDDADDS